MPENYYIPPRLFENGHIQTIYPILFRQKPPIRYLRERIHTPDRDFLDLDWSFRGYRKLAIISHGLEGNSNRTYVKGMVKAVNDSGWDALAWNFRSCSGEPNRLLRSYHSGTTADLFLVTRHAADKGRYAEIALIGFSLGGNFTLLHLGKETPHPLISKAVVISVPCDLKESAKKLAKPANQIYMKRFLIMLRQKIRAKMAVMPGLINDDGFESIRDFKAFDDRYTAPIHGFKNAEDYWEKYSSRPWLGRIRVPTLIINAENDPFLGPACFPTREANTNKNIFLLMPKSGGHVGFITFNRLNRYWSEQQTVNFLNTSFL